MKKLAFLDSSIKSIVLPILTLCLCLNAYASSSNSEQDKTENSVSSHIEEVIVTPSKEDMLLFNNSSLYSDYESFDWLSGTFDLLNPHKENEAQSSVEVPFKPKSNSEQIDS